MGTLPPKDIVYHCSASTHSLVPVQHLADNFLRGDISKACYLFNFSCPFISFHNFEFAVDPLLVLKTCKRSIIPNTDLLPTSLASPTPSLKIALSFRQPDLQNGLIEVSPCLENFSHVTLQHQNTTGKYPGM